MLELHDYQKRAVQFCLDVKQAYLAIDLGMGKTAISLEVIKQIKQPAMVFGPLRTIYSSWPEEIQKWAPELSYEILHGQDKSLANINDKDILLMNYEGLKWLSQQSAKWRKRAVIYDESSMVKSHGSQRFNLLKKSNMFWTEYRLCLSATPAANGLHELWSQYYLLDQGKALGKNITQFRKAYCTGVSYPGMPVVVYTVSPAVTETLYKAIAPRTFRLEASDYLDMPPISYNQIKCELTKTLAKKYKTLENDFFLELEEQFAEAPNTALLGMKLRQFVQGGIYSSDKQKKWIELHKIKLAALKELLETSAGRPILCAIQFKGELAAITEALGDVPLIAGGTSATLAAKYIEQWNKGEIPLLLCHPASLSHGVNLQAGGSILLWYGLTWSLEQYQQLIGRLHRQGQKDPVVIHHLIMKNTIDEPIMQALSDKNVTQKALLDYLKTYHKGKR